MTFVVAPGTFSLAVSFTAERVEIDIRGELDLSTRGRFTSVLDAIVGENPTEVVLDLRDCGFLDAACLRLIRVAAADLRRSGGSLSVRSPPPAVRRLLDLTGAADLVLPDGPGPVGLEAVSTGNEVVDGALRMVVTLTRTVVRSGDGVSVSLRRGSRLSTVAATNQTVLAMDADQYATGQGPCVDASTEGRWFLADSLATELRWPDFTPRALGLGINAILSSPLVVRDRPIGALNIYSRSSSAFSEADQRAALALAAEASTILDAAGPGAGTGETTRRMTGALRSRHVIAVAQGVLMERSGVDENRAHAVLRGLALGHGVPLRAEADAVISSTVGPTAPGGREPTDARSD